MTLMRVELEPLPPEQVLALYSRAKKYERVFRDLLIDLADTEQDAYLFRYGSIDTIFERYVQVDGDKQRVGEFQVGPNVVHHPNFSDCALPKDQALILIEREGTQQLFLYRILDDMVKLIGQDEYNQL